MNEVLEALINYEYYSEDIYLMSVLWGLGIATDVMMFGNKSNLYDRYTTDPTGKDFNRRAVALTKIILSLIPVINTALIIADIKNVVEWANKKYR